MSTVMATRHAAMPSVDLMQARRAWKTGAARLHFGSCDHCHRVAGDDGRPLLVARQERSRMFLCFECFVARRLRPRRRLKVAA